MKRRWMKRIAWLLLGSGVVAVVAYYLSRPGNGLSPAELLAISYEIDRGIGYLENWDEGFPTSELLGSLVPLLLLEALY